MGHVVAARMIVVKTAGTERYLGRGARLPADVDTKEIARLAGLNLIKVEEADGKAKAASRAGSRRGAPKTGEPKGETGNGGQPAGGEHPADGEQPAGDGPAKTE